MRAWGTAYARHLGFVIERRRLVERISQAQAAQRAGMLLDFFATFFASATALAAPPPMATATFIGIRNLARRSRN